MNPNDERHLTIHFNNQTQMELTFPKQLKDSIGAVMEAMKRAMESDKLVIEADGRLLVIPWASIKTVEITPMPPAVPFGAIRGARVAAT